MSLRRVAVATTLFVAAMAAQAQVFVSEGFDNVAGLVGWAQADTSTPAGTPWFQGNAGIFGSQSGAANAYIAADPVSTQGSFASSVSKYLITPNFSLATPIRLSFFARSTGVSEGAPDRLQVLLSTAGSSTAVASFTSLLFDTAGIANGWTPEIVDIGAQSASATGRIAFRYFIPDTSAAGSYLGIDTVTIAAVPEPSVVASMLMGFGALSLAISRARRKGRKTTSQR